MSVIIYCQFVSFLSWLFLLPDIITNVDPI